MKRRVVGLLGGSFNPAHAGHLHISLYALQKLGLDEVWWLVSPHNPLKEKQTLADYGLRLESARYMATHPRIKVSDVENQKGLFYTYNTLRYLQRHYPAVTFVWLMGADNLDGFDRWQRWQWIFKNIPLVVFDRVPFSHKAMHSKAAIAARRFFIRNNQINGAWRAPQLHMAHIKRAYESSTSIRKSLGKSAFLGHTKGVK